MKIVIHNPALTGPDIIRWGDYHFGRSLEKALRAAGAEVEQRFWPDWNQPVEADTLLILRGNRAWLPPPGPKNLLWVVSNSSTISSVELDRYDVIFAASETLRKRLALMTSRPLERLLQCTDTSLFYPPNEPVSLQATERDGIIMVGNSRSVRRPTVDWAVQAGIKVDLYGNRWPVVGLGQLVKQNHIANEDLPALYRRSRISLNDHWADMQHDQIISNRIFDGLACGLPMVSDWFPELEEVCGDAVRYTRDSATMREAIEKLEKDYPQALEAAKRFALTIAREHSFDVRAREILTRAANITARPKTLLAANVNNPNDEAPTFNLSFDLPKPLNETRVLHINPSQDKSRALAALSFKNYRSAGFGTGPWHIALDKRLTVLGTQEYDLIYVQTIRMKLFDRFILSLRLARNMTRRSIMIYHPRRPGDSLLISLARKIRWLRKGVLYMFRDTNSEW